MNVKYNKKIEKRETKTVPKTRSSTVKNIYNLFIKQPDLTTLRRPNLCKCLNPYF